MSSSILFTLGNRAVVLERLVYSTNKTTRVSVMVVPGHDKYTFIYKNERHYPMSASSTEHSDFVEYSGALLEAYRAGKKDGRIAPETYNADIQYLTDNMMACLCRMHLLTLAKGLVFPVQALNIQHEPTVDEGPTLSSNSVLPKLRETVQTFDTLMWHRVAEHVKEHTYILHLTGEEVSGEDLAAITDEFLVHYTNWSHEQTMVRGQMNIHSNSTYGFSTPTTTIDTVESMGDMREEDIPLKNRPLLERLDILRANSNKHNIDLNNHLRKNKRY